MYEYQGIEKIKDINLDKNITYLEIEYKAQYYLEWTSAHYGEDEVPSINNNSLYHSGPQGIEIIEFRFKAYDNNGELVKSNMKIDFFKDIIFESIRKDASQRRY